MNTARIIHHSENIPNMMYTDSALMRAWAPSAMSDRYFDFAMKSLCDAPARLKTSRLHTAGFRIHLNPVL